MNPRKRLRRPTTLGLAAALCMSATTGLSQWQLQAPPDIDLEPRQLFALTVEGPRPIQGSRPFRQRGTAFAIAEGTLITARHVVGEHDAFRNLVENNDDVQVPDRTSTLFYAPDETRTLPPRDYRSMSVTPAPIRTVDAARLDLEGLPVVPMQLSACEIDVNTRYYLLKLNNGNVDSPRAVTLTPDVDRFTGRGDLRMFTHSEPRNTQPVGGDSGSPVVDSMGRVVGLLTAIDSAASEVFVSLTPTWLDLVPADVPVACDPRVWPEQMAALEAQIDLLETQLFARNRQFWDTNQGLLDVISEQRDLIDAQRLVIEEMQESIDTLDTIADSIALFSNVGLSALADTEESATDFVNQLRVLVEEELPGMENEEVRDEILTRLDRLERVGDQIGDDPSLVPTVREIRALLSRPEIRLEADWQPPSNPGANSEPLLPSINLRYSRELAGPILADHLRLCVRPIFPYSGETKVFNVPTNLEFYTAGSLDQYGDPPEGPGLDRIVCYDMTLNTETRVGPRGYLGGTFRGIIPRIGGLFDRLHSDFATRREADGLPEDLEWDGRAYVSVHMRPNRDEPYGVMLHALVSLDPNGVAAGAMRCQGFQTAAEVIGFLVSDNAELEQRSPCYTDG